MSAACESFRASVLFKVLSQACHCSCCSAGAAVPVPTEEQMLDTLVFKDGPSQSLYH